MELSKKVKVALDETRMLILGAQILLGFQFRGVFGDGYDQLPADSRYLSGVALGLMICVVGLLITPGPYHRMVEAGMDSGRFHRLVTIVAELALMSVVNGQSNSRPLRDDRWLLAGVGSGVLLHRAGDGALRRRLIKLLSADWVPPSVSSSRGWSFV